MNAQATVTGGWGIHWGAGILPANQTVASK